MMTRVRELAMATVQANRRRSMRCPRVNSDTESVIELPRTGIRACKSRLNVTVLYPSRCRKFFASLALPARASRAEGTVNGVSRDNAKNPPAPRLSRRSTPPAHRTVFSLAAFSALFYFLSIPTPVRERYRSTKLYRERPAICLF